MQPYHLSLRLPPSSSNRLRSSFQASKKPSSTRRTATSSLFPSLRVKKSSRLRLSLRLRCRLSDRIMNIRDDLAREAVEREGMF